ncbi:MAG: alpha-glucuronidase [Chloroflexi bacterium]|nr:alpha-glucuronidase [Chloroflexota bacterium]
MQARNESGYELWLRYRPLDDAERLAQYRAAINSVVVLGTSATAAIIKNELVRAMPALLDVDVPFVDNPIGNTLIVGTVDELKTIGVSISPDDSRNIGDEGCVIASAEGAKQSLISNLQSLRDAPQSPISNLQCLITANAAPAVLTGVFHLLRLLQTHQDIRALDIVSVPKIRHRILAHWDNLDGTIERGYAGRSLWNWDELPAKIAARYHDYARACASIGINGACLTNVNASIKGLTAEYLEKTAALADGFRPYGVRVFLSPQFTAPVRIGGLSTSDPRDPNVAAWWKDKVDEIYRLIPDFGGFQVKANSEGQPGPQDNGANHDDGANMLADALAPHGGFLLWRAFVYDTNIDADRANCANKEFVPLDGKFRSNVLVQAKNGPIDFQPREPFHPLFGAMPRTPLALELQITQEYLGQSKHLVYLGGMWKEVLDSDTYAQGVGSTVAKIVSAPMNSCIVGVANTGTDRNWCGHHFSQANWYAFGRLAWDYELSAEAIADEWIRMTWSNESRVVDMLKPMMLGSWEACVNYMMPLGLHHLMKEHHHYGPDPGFNGAPRPDWNNVYYHRADMNGIGFDRTHTGSINVGMYHRPLCEEFDNIATCPEKFLLWFHHVPWHHRLYSGRTLWQELQHRYDEGITFVEEMQNAWQRLQSKIDGERFEHVRQRLTHQLENAREWRDVCIEYFGQFQNSATESH